MNDQLDDPGVAVYFRLKSEPRVMARDRHPMPAENLHAIGHVIEALRSIDRHGGGYMMARAFSAFTALPAPDRAKPWRDVLGFAPQQNPGKTAIDAAFRERARKAHPDSGGSDARMAELNRAREEAYREVLGAAA
jgi:hypothetical protein